MKTPIFTGTCTALVTPFRDGKVNYSMLEALIRRQIDAGIPAIVLCGTTGEAATLSDEEKLEIFRWGKRFAGEDCKILAGTGSNCTEHAVSLTKAAADRGVDGLLVVSPYYNKATPSGLLVHYEAVARASDLPMILYNVPTRTSVDIPVEVYAELSQLPTVQGVKEASASLRKLARIRAACPEDFTLWSGNDDLTVPILSLGAKGVISVTSNLYPERMKAMTDAALRGDFPGAAALQLELLPLMEALFSEVNPIPVKAALRELGFDCGDCRLPLTPLSSAHQEALRSLLR